MPGSRCRSRGLDFQTLHIVGFRHRSSNAAHRRLRRVRGGAMDGGKIAAELDRIGIHGQKPSKVRCATRQPGLDQPCAFRTLSRRGGRGERTSNDVFLNYLARGKPGLRELRLGDAGGRVRWIKGAGGLAVSSSGRYRLSTSKWTSRLTSSRELGGDAVEVSLRGPRWRDRCWRFAHGPEQVWPARFCGRRISMARGQPDRPRPPPLPPDLTPVWSRLCLNRFPLLNRHGPVFRSFPE